MTELSIFTDALEKPDPAERAAFLDAACAGNLALRARVEGLLAAHAGAGGVLDRPVVGSLPDGDAGVTRTHGGDGGDTRTHGDGTDEDTADALAFLTPSQRPDSLGRIGHYEVLEVLGRGGFGIVYRAFDDVLQRVVAVKVLSPQMAATSPARKRFLREARSSAAVRHENVVQVHGVEEQPLPYLVMEFIPGETLQQRLDRTGPLDVPEVLRIGRQIAEGLAAAHEMGLIHRDIKPANVMIEKSPQARVKITDFGLARAADDASLTRSGTVAGTPMYMAPEQARGEPLDHRADLFSLGSVLYVMCTGRPPFRAQGTLAVLKRVAEDTPRPIREVIPEVPEWFCRIVEKLHAKNPAERFQTAREVVDVLADCENQLKTNSKITDFSRIPGGSPLTRRRIPSRRVARYAGFIVVTALLLFLKWLILSKLTLYLYSSDVDHVTVTGDRGLQSLRITKDGVVVKELQFTNRMPFEYDFVFELERGTYRIEAECAAGARVDSIWVESSSVFEGNGFSTPTPTCEFTVDGGRRTVIRIKIEDAPPHPVAVSPLTPPFAVAPFDAAQAIAHQLAWARHLGVDVETTNSLGMKFQLIPPGEFTMGNADENPFTQPEDKPQHRVKLTKPFYLATHETTVGEFTAFRATVGEKTFAEADPRGAQAAEITGYHRRPGLNWRTPGFPQADNHPVTCVTWAEANAFCEWLSKRDGRTYRLPTDAEWEFACRAGTTSAYYYGQKADPTFAAVQRWDEQKKTLPVGSLPANPFGLRDMLGNVYEWCHDGQRAYTLQAVTDPVGPTDPGARRVRRGGAWSSGLDQKGGAVCGSRTVGPPDDDAAQTVGFRVAIVGDLKPPAGVAPTPGAELAPLPRQK